MRSLVLFASVVSLVVIATAKPQDLTSRGNSDNNNGQNHGGNNYNGQHHGGYINNGNHHGNEFDKFYSSYPLKANWFHAFQFCRFKKSFLISIDASSKLELVNKYIESQKLNNGIIIAH